MKKLPQLAFSPGKHDNKTSLGLLLIRIIQGGFMLLFHGWGKLSNFSTLAEAFPDPLGMGAKASLILAIGAEVICSIAVIIGFGTRIAAFPLVITMLVAAFLVHGDDPFSKKEFAMVYAIPFLLLIFSGAGRFSVDSLMDRRS